MVLNKNNFLQEEPASGGGAKAVLLFVVLGLLLVLALTAAGYLYLQLNDYKNDPQRIMQDELNGLVKKVGGLIVLPDNEQPTVATVTNLEKLKSQPFFNKAKVGDKVLIYTNAKKAILYDPVNNKIVEVAPLNIGAPAGE